MQTERSTAEAGYASAYQAHYTDKDMLEALRLYAILLKQHPDTRQSRDARVQIRNITSQLASPPEIVQSDLLLALRHITSATEVPIWVTEILEQPANDTTESK